MSNGTYDPHRAILLVRGTRPDPAFSEANRGKVEAPEGFTLMRATAALSIFNPPAEGSAWKVPKPYDGDAVGGSAAVSGVVLGVLELPEGQAAKALADVASGRYDTGRGVDVRDGASIDEIMADWNALAAIRGAEVRYQSDVLVDRERVGIAEAFSASVSDLSQISSGDPRHFAFSATVEDRVVHMVTSDREHGRMLSSYAALDGAADVTLQIAGTGPGPVVVDVVNVEPRMLSLMVSRDEANYALANDADAARRRAAGEVTPTGEALRHLTGAVSQPVFKRDRNGNLRESGRMVGREALAKSFAWESKSKFRSVGIDVSQVSGHLRQMIRPLADRTRSSLKVAVSDAKTRSAATLREAGLAPPKAAREKPSAGQGL